MINTQVSLCSFWFYTPIILMCYIGSLMGFTNLGDINTHLQQYEQSLQAQSEKPLANSMLVLMVRGLFSKLEFPYVQFPCIELSGEQIYDPLWEAVCRLERCGFHVLALVCDGLAANRRLFKLHNPSASPSDVLYKVYNPYSTSGQFLYFVSDPPHLIKTVRNAWANKKRRLWVRYSYIDFLKTYNIFWFLCTVPW